MRCFDREGINVTDDEGRVLGKSKTAGWMAVSQVAVSRVATALPCLTLPPLIMSRLERTSLFQARPGLGYFANFALITLSLMTALPVAIALFPQQGAISVQQLEPEFQKCKLKSGKPVDMVYYNKGL